ncbi:serine/threonine protein kinase [Myxococcota bacterium]|nr:serine/threonine protein kinase [Myxococcota bacterium]MBU1410928.1 serine/threonine protein kinase [Myxococcota bacterium]MBU1510380.1 serine/threonine protein kinase [Myxococcota bacterium]
MTTRRPIQFGKYLLLDRIAIGGMAEIFRAKTSGAARFEKIIAIKRIHPNMSDDKDFIKMFIDEAKISGQLNHPSIAQIYELGRIEGHHFIAMEFIWGKDLLQILSKFKKQRAYMNPFQAAFIISKICEGLDYAHKKKDAQGQSIGIIHRDVSPQNILISYEGDIKIIDFGIAKARDRSSHTAAGVLKGKFGYMSPEQIRGLPIDHRSDIFAIGTLLFEMLTSRPLFTGESDLTVLEKVRNVDIPKPREVNKEIPAEMERIILKALTRQVEDRYQHASEMQEDLERYIYTAQPIYTGKRLGSWMQKVFQLERDREKSILDEMLAVAEEQAQETSVKSTINTAMSQSTQQQQQPVDEPPPEGATVMIDDEDDREPGTLAQPRLPPPPVVSDIHDERTRFLEDDDDDEPPSEEATRILEDDEDPIRPMLAGVGGARPAPGPAPAITEQKTQIFDDDDPSMNVQQMIRPNTVPPGQGGPRPPMPMGTPPMGTMNRPQQGGPSRPPGPNPYAQQPGMGPPPMAQNPNLPPPGEDFSVPGLYVGAPKGPDPTMRLEELERQLKTMKIMIAVAGVAGLVVGLVIGKIL